MSSSVSIIYCACPNYPLLLLNMYCRAKSTFNYLATSTPLPPWAWLKAPKWWKAPLKIFTHTHTQSATTAVAWMYIGSVCSTVKMTKVYKSKWRRGWSPNSPLSGRTLRGDRMAVWRWSKSPLYPAEIDARSLFCGTEIFSNRVFSHRLTTMLKLVLAKMPKTA